MSSKVYFKPRGLWISFKLFIKWSATYTWDLLSFRYFPNFPKHKAHCSGLVYCYTLIAVMGWLSWIGWLLWVNCWGLVNFCGLIDVGFLLLVGQLLCVVYCKLIVVGYLLWVNQLLWIRCCRFVDGDCELIAMRWWLWVLLSIIYLLNLLFAPTIIKENCYYFLWELSCNLFPEFIISISFCSHYGLVFVLLNNINSFFIIF